VHKIGGITNLVRCGPGSHQQPQKIKTPVLESGAFRPQEPRKMALEQIVNRVSEQLSQVLPPGVRQLRGDLEDNIKAVLREALARMELVTREEFDVQAALLSRARSRLEAMEAELRTLEQRVTALENRGK
jgi:BMFP domain-containing protein YqiC